ncbi:hypothetical protein BGW36DRAFT_393389 [Talaromyces proteolyticus]|uniref:Peptidase C45 hydrolase domain-containing protein n=1 Tax=Talaromyces proteolyticus TaxID=1131652 RepID=A0AAD4L1N8_9EURO|nr:uncharacterized protein BGW36DRAFT_393389 [Talaromyces proteolyticus]KAH8705918.1 hypothetical protein BGW36DRAFT_393389 [Talaromyces proteolyticus]
MHSLAPPDVYQHVIVRGLPYDRGLSHGYQVKDKILRNIAYYKQPGKLVPLHLAAKIIRECYIPGLRKYWPSGLEEMRGVAAGAGVDLEDIVMLNARYDLSHFHTSPAEPKGTIDDASGCNGVTTNGFSSAAPPECTSAIFLSEATCNGHVFTAQNWDMSHRLYTEDSVIYLEVHPDPSENIPSMFIVTEAGQLCRSGINSAGLGLTANSLQSSMDEGPVPVAENSGLTSAYPEIPPCSALRRLFLEQSNFADGLKRIARTPRHVSSNIMVSTAENIGLCLEVTPKTIFRVSISSSSTPPYLIHSNHFQTPQFLAQSEVFDTYGGGSSWYRGDRLEAGVKQKACRGALTDSDIINAFQDHAGYPHSLCEHTTEGHKKIGASVNNEVGPYSGPTSTVCCVLYNLSKRSVRTQENI